MRGCRRWEARLERGRERNTKGSVFGGPPPLLDAPFLPLGKTQGKGRGGEGEVLGKGGTKEVTRYTRNQQLD